MMAFCRCTYLYKSENTLSSSFTTACKCQTEIIGFAAVIIDNNSFILDANADDEMAFRRCISRDNDFILF